MREAAQDYAALLSLQVGGDGVDLAGIVGGVVRTNREIADGGAETVRRLDADDAGGDRREDQEAVAKEQLLFEGD